MGVKDKPQPISYFNIYVTVLDNNNNKIPSVIEVVGLEDPYFAQYGNTEFGAIPSGTRLVDIKVGAEGFKPFTGSFNVYPNVEVYITLESLAKPEVSMFYKGRGSAIGLGYAKQSFPHQMVYVGQEEAFLERLANWKVSHHTTIIDGNVWGLVGSPEEIDWTRKYGIPFVWTNNNWDITRISEEFAQRMYFWTELCKQYGIINNYVLSCRYTGLDKAQEGSEFGPYLMNHQGEFRTKSNPDNFWNLGPDTAWRTLASFVLGMNREVGVPDLICPGNESKGKEFHRNSADFILGISPNADILVNRQSSLPGDYDEHLMEKPTRFHKVEWHGRIIRDIGKREGYLKALDYVHPEESAHERLSYTNVKKYSKLGWNPNLINISNDGGRISDFAEDTYDYPGWLQVIGALGLRNFTHQSIMKLPMRNGLTNDLTMMDIEHNFMVQAGELVYRQ